ncbi:MAG: NAD(P)H-dependent oxidoreductase [Gemmataceae bacterium]
MSEATNPAPLRILAVGGSLRVESGSTRACRIALDAAAARGAEVRFFDLRTAGLPLYSPDAGPDERVQAAAAAVVWADAYLLASPDYHGSMSGAMKNFLDYHWEEFAGKLFGYICASHEKGLTAMDHMRTSVRQCYGWSLPYGVSVYREQDFDTVGEPTPKLRARLDMLGRDIVVYGRLLRVQFLQDAGGKAADSFAARYKV